MTFHRRYSRDRESRMSIESNMTFGSSDKIFDGDELVDVFQNPNAIAHDMSTSSIPPIQFIKTSTKRPSANDFAGSNGEILLGEDLAEMFKSQGDSDKSMGMSFATYRRRSTLSRDKRDSLISFSSDRRESLMSLGDCSMLEGTTQAEDKQVKKENNDSQMSDMDIQPTPLPPAPISIAPKVEVKPDMTGSSSSSSNHRSSTTSNNSDTEDGDVEYIEKIGPYDIICGRNNGAHNWVGNRRFRITIMMNLKRYTDAPTREEKTHVIKSVIDLLISTEQVGARFIKKVGEGMYVRLKDKQIREKVGHAFREMMSLQEQEGGALEAKCFQ